MKYHTYKFITRMCVRNANEGGGAMHKDAPGRGRSLCAPAKSTQTQTFNPGTSQRDQQMSNDVCVLSLLLVLLLLRARACRIISRILGRYPGSPLP